MTKRKGYWDVIVVGAGNAAHAAAVSACESGAQRVLMLEKHPRTSAVVTPITVAVCYGLLSTLQMHCCG